MMYYLRMAAVFAVFTSVSLRAETETTNLHIQITKVIWPYPVSVEEENEVKLVERHMKTVALIVVKSPELSRFTKSEEGLVTAFVSVAKEEDLPKKGEHYAMCARTGELWTINLPLNPKEPPDAFTVWENAISLKKIPSPTPSANAPVELRRNRWNESDPDGRRHGQRGVAAAWLGGVDHSGSTPCALCLVTARRVRPKPGATAGGSEGGQMENRPGQPAPARDRGRTNQIGRKGRSLKVKARVEMKEGGRGRYRIVSSG